MSSEGDGKTVSSYTNERSVQIDVSDLCCVDGPRVAGIQRAKRISNSNSNNTWASFPKQSKHLV